MAITAGDILIKLSVNAAAGNTTAQGNINNSLGDQVSTTQVSGTSLNNLFDDISGDENAASESEYRCIFVHNAHGSLALQNAVIWISSQTAGGADVSIGLDPTAASSVGSGSAQAVTVADENTAPAGVTFSTPTTKGTGLSLGTLNAGQVKAVWLKRTANNTAAVSGDGVTLSIAGDTAA